MDQKRFIKSLVYRYLSTEDEATSNYRYAMALIRGDLEINETKLKNVLCATEIEKAEIDEAMEKLAIPIGFAGPIGVSKFEVVADHSVKSIKGGVTGANRKDVHYIHVNADRDFTPALYTDIRLIVEGDPCPICGEPIKLFKGIELGHIFKLGDKYTKAFSVTYLDEAGSERVPIMGCYGIGVERTVAAIIEQNHDEDGIIWPVSVAPFQVYLLPVKYSGKTREICDRMYRELSSMGIEALLDDRELRPGVKFKDADLLGIPYRITVGDRGIEEGTVELVGRRSKVREKIGIDDVIHTVSERIRQDLASFT
jgi:prolyl-tRNA synthetase